MAIEKENLESIKKCITENYISSFNALEGTTKYSMLKVIAEVEAGIYHQLLGDIEFLSKQIFPDTAEGVYLRSHWADRVPPLYAECASGYITLTGIAGVKVPAGCVFSSAAGNKYYTRDSVKINESGNVEVFVEANEGGLSSNLAKGSVLKLSSNLIAGMDTEAKVIEIGGGTDGESDEAYLMRVLNYSRVSNRYGRVGDFAAWAIDASSEVTKAFEFKNFDVFGSLLITVVGGNAESGFVKVFNTDTVKKYLENFAPPVLFTVRSADIIEIVPTVTLSKKENTVGNRNIIRDALKQYFDTLASPNMTIAESVLQKLINDGVNITNATLTLEKPNIVLSVLEYPVLGEVIWA